MQDRRFMTPLGLGMQSGTWISPMIYEVVMAAWVARLAVASDERSCLRDWQLLSLRAIRMKKRLRPRRTAPSRTSSLSSRTSFGNGQQTRVQPLSVCCTDGAGT